MSNARYAKLWRLDTARHGMRRIPTDEARTAILGWTGEGYSLSQIATAARCSREEISQIAKGQRRRAHRVIVRAILRARLDPADIPDYTPIDATGSQRRLRALFAIGHSLRALAVELGSSPSTLSHIVNGAYSKVRKGIARAIATAYRRLSRTPGASKQARTLAAQRGWYGPMAWGPDIDDPAALPDTAGLLAQAA